MGTNDITARDQRVIEHFKTACENLREISPELLADISKFIISLSESHKHKALAMIADYLVSTMKVHALSLMTTFQNNADQEDIRPEHCKETLEEVFSETFRLLNEDLSIQSLDALYTLAHVTGTLQTLSQTTSASMAQNWLYDLASMYHEELEEEHLTTKEMSSYSIPVDISRQRVLVSFEFKSDKSTRGGNYGKDRSLTADTSEKRSRQSFISSSSHLAS